jgi:hypothetical protein
MARCAMLQSMKITSDRSLISPAWLPALSGDLAVFVVFAALGRNSHHESQGLADAIVTALPFWGAWLVVAPLLGAFSARSNGSAGEAVRTTSRAWLCAWPLALLLRAAVQRRGIAPGFDIVALLANMLFLVTWRSLLSFIASAQARRHRP